MEYGKEVVRSRYRKTKKEEDVPRGQLGEDRDLLFKQSAPASAGNKERGREQRPEPGSLVIATFCNRYKETITDISTHSALSIQRPVMSDTWRLVNIYSDAQSTTVKYVFPFSFKYTCGSWPCFGNWHRNFFTIYPHMRNIAIFFSSNDLGNNNFQNLESMWMF